jgi:hypothetical protein
MSLTKKDAKALFNSVDKRMFKDAPKVAGLASFYENIIINAATINLLREHYRREENAHISTMDGLIVLQYDFNLFAGFGFDVGFDFSVLSDISGSPGGADGFVDAIFVLSPRDFLHVVGIDDHQKYAVLLYMSARGVVTVEQYFNHAQQIREMLAADVEGIQPPDMDL